MKTLRISFLLLLFCPVLLLGQTADFTLSSTTVCIGDAVTVIDNSSGSPSSWLWTFGAGASPASDLTKTPPAISWSTAGLKNITLTTNGSNIITKYVYVYPKPTASFLSGTASICAGSTNLQVAITGGTSPYTVNIDNVAATTNLYTSGDNISVSPNATTNYSLTSVTDANGCLSSGLSGTPTVTVNTQPVAPTLSAKTPNTASVCDGTNVSAIFNSGTGGVGCTDAYQYRLDNGSWSSYTPGSNISTTGHTSVDIQAERAGCTGAGCSGTSWTTLASWVVNPNPTASVLSGAASICSGSTNLQVAITGATSTYTVNINNAGTTASYASGNNISVSPAVTTTYSLTSVTDGNGCLSSGLSGTPTVTVNGPPIAPTLIAKTPGTASVCDGTSVSAIFNPGTGGAGCTDAYQYRFDGGSWSTYTLGSNLNTTGHTSVEIQVERAGCTGAGCSGTSWTTLASWVVNPNPTASVLSGAASICSGSTNLQVAITGATSTYTVNINNAETTASYASGNNISVSPAVTTTYSLTSVTDANGCVSSGLSGTPTVTVNTQPVAPTLSAKIPNTASVCEGTNVSAVFTPGSGGVGCSDSYQYSINNGSTWIAYTPGATISTTGYSTVIIQGERAGCTGTGCSGTSWTTLATWNINANPTSANLSGAAAICNGGSTNLQVAITGGASPYSVVVANAGTFNAYTSGSNISVTPTITTSYSLTTITDTNGCFSDGLTGTPIVTVHTNPTASVLIGTAPICIGASTNLQVDITGGASPFAVSIANAGLVNAYYSGNNILVTPAITTAYSLTSVADANGCLSSGLSGVPIVTVNAIPSILSITNDSICDLGSPKLSAIGSGGILNWYNVTSGGISLGTGNTFTTPSITTTTPYYVDVTQNGCTSPRSMVEAIVNKKTTPTISGLLNSYSVSDYSGYTLIGDPANGVFSGNGVIGNIFYPFVAGLNTSGFNIKYIYTNNKGCADSAKQQVTVVNLVAGFSDLQTVYCMNSNPTTTSLSITGSGTITNKECTSYFQDNLGKSYIDNGSYGVTDNGSGVLTLTPASMRAGTHYVTATYKNDGASFTTPAQYYTVDTIPTVDIDNLASAYCNYSTNTTVRLKALKAGTNGSHIWTDYNNSATTSTRDYFDLDLSSIASSANPYSISYQFETANGCVSNVATKTFLMNATPTVSIPMDSVYNIAGPAVSLKGNHDPYGVFSGLGVNELTANLKYQFLPSAVGGQSNVTITYKYTDPSTECFSSTSANFSIYQATDTIRGDIRVFCHRENPVTFSISNKHGITGTFRLAEKPAALVDGANNTATFDPAVFKEGTDTIIYLYNYKNAYFQVKKTVSVDSVSSAIDFTVPSSKFDYCDYDNAVQLTATNLYPDPTKGYGTWTYPAGLLTTANNIATLDPLKATSETNTVNYYYTSSGGCVSRIASHIFTIYTRPTVAFTNLKGNYNIAVDTFILRGSPSTGGVGAFSGNGLSTDGVLRPANIGVKTASPVSYQFTETRSNCYNTANQTINIVQADATITTSKSTYCYTDAPETISATATNGLATPIDTLSGPGINYLGNSQATFDPKLAGTGTKTITYTYRGSDGYTQFTVTKTILVDEIGIAKISGLNDEYCTSADRQIINGFISNSNGTANFDGPTSGFHNQGLNAFFNTDTIGIIESPVRIRLTYTSPQGCITRDSAFITIHKTPELSFSTVNACFDESTTAKPVTFPNQSVYNSSDDVTWTWDYGDNSGKINTFEGSHNYTAGGPMLITLAAETDKGCTASSVSKTVNIDTRPYAKFVWSDECFIENTPIQFTNKTSNIQTNSISYNWYFKNNNQTDSINGQVNSSKLYTTPGDYNISLVAVTQEGCRDTSSIVFHLRPTYKLTDKEYRENFESTQNYWIDTTTVSSPNRWIWGVPTSTSACTYPASGAKVMYTEINTRSQKDQLVLEGPCFDFTDTQRPIISFQSWKAFELNRDGAVLQYQKGDATDWVTLGVKGDGVNWYNSNSILTNPLNVSQGWTCSSSNLFDSTWNDSRHSLDDLIGQSKVRFRFVFVSNGTGQENRGFSLDSIWIGERKRNVVLEHFGDNSDVSVSAEKLLDNAVSLYPNDILNIRYHTGSDPFGLLYPAGPRVRSMMYQLTKVPFSIVDGLSTSNYVDYTATVWNDDTYRNMMLESLHDPTFDIQVTSEGTSGLAKVLVNISNILKDTLPATKRILYVAAIESEVVSDGTTYKNVLRGMLPDVSGTIFESAWIPAATQNVSLNWTIANVTDVSKLRFVAFIQDDESKDIYQAAIDSQGSISTGVTTISKTKVDNIQVYPNPASGYCTIVLTGSEQYPVKANIIDQYGAVLSSKTLTKGQTTATIGLQDMANGLYFVRLTEAAGSIIHTQKLIVVHR